MHWDGHDTSLSLLAQRGGHGRLARGRRRRRADVHAPRPLAAQVQRPRDGARRPGRCSSTRPQPHRSTSSPTAPARDGRPGQVRDGRPQHADYVAPPYLGRRTRGDEVARPTEKLGGVHRPARMRSRADGRLRFVELLDTAVECRRAISLLNSFSSNAMLKRCSPDIRRWRSTCCADASSGVATLFLPPRPLLPTTSPRISTGPKVRRAPVSRRRSVAASTTLSHPASHQGIRPAGKPDISQSPRADGGLRIGSTPPRP